MKKTSMLNPVKSLGYRKFYSSSSTRPTSSSSSFISSPNSFVRKYSVDQGNLRPFWKSEKVPHILNCSTSLIKFLQDFTNYRKKTNRVFSFSFRPLTNILKHRNHKWDLQAIIFFLFFFFHFFFYISPRMIILVFG